MAKGIVLGLLTQVVSAIGMVFIANVTTIKNDVLKASLTLCFGGVVALGIATYLFLSGTEPLSLFGSKDMLYLAIGSMIAFPVGHILYMAGLSASNVTTMAYTALAFPVVSLILELVLGRIKLTALTVHDWVGFALLVAGYVIMISKKNT